jgi:hypothetical protein
MKFILLILEYTLSSIVVFFILKFEVYEVHVLHCYIFVPTFGMHNNTP